MQFADLPDTGNHEYSARERDNPALNKSDVVKIFLIIDRNLMMNQNHTYPQNSNWCNNKVIHICIFKGISNKIFRFLER